jgi:glutamate racemase
MEKGKNVEERMDRACGPIGVFDSGIGGLTVAAAIRRRLGGEDVFYFGDTARVPYGGKSRATVERYSLEISGLLLAEGAKAIVVACNTASALALERLRELFRAPIIGVVDPGAEAAVRQTTQGKIGVMGTRATIRSGAYERAIRALAPQAEVFSMACPLLVPLIEEGWLQDPVTDAVLERYLAPLLEKGIDTLVLGCTHYPLARAAIGRLAPGVTLVDSAENLALALAGVLAEGGLLHPAGNRTGRLQVALSDAPDGFLRVAEKELDLPLGHIELRPVQSAAPVQSSAAG